MPVLTHIASRLFCAAACFVAADAAIFRTGFYNGLIEPDSSTGFLQLILRYEKSRAGRTPRDVLAIGNSRMGFKPRAANETASESGLRFASIATPGTTPRCWYYMLRDVDPDVSRYAAILIGVEDYEDEDYEDLSNREMDIRYVAPMLGWSDLFEFPASYPKWSTRGEAFRAALLKGYAYRADFQDLLVNHKYRMRKIEYARSNGAAARYREIWGSNDMAGLRVNWVTRTAEFAPAATADQRRVMEEILQREPAPQTGDRARYLRKWYGRILQHYRGSRTRIVFLRLPRGPVVLPALVRKETAVVRELARANRQVVLLPEHAFDSLEDPANFGDPLHLNERGALAFSRMAALETGRALAP